MLPQKRAESLYEDLNKTHGEESDSTPFNASHGRFHQSKARAKLYSVEVSGKATNADMVAV